MRAVLISFAALAVAGASAAQPLPLQPPPVQPLPVQPLRAQPRSPANAIQLQAELHNMQAQQNMAQQQEIGLGNQLNAEEAQTRTQHNLALLHSPTNPQAFAPVTRPGAPLPQIDTSQLASMPDATLARSNARVRAAALDRP